MSAAKKHPTKTAAKKRRTKAAAGGHHTQAAAGRHHTVPPHPGEFDIDLNSPHAELQPLLKKLRPLLQEVIETSQRCNKDGQEAFAPNYHNITVCKH